MSNEYMKVVNQYMSSDITIMDDGTIKASEFTCSKKWMKDRVNDFSYF